MAQNRSLYRFSSRLAIFAMVLQVAFAPAAPALQIQTSQSIRLREMEGSQMERVGLLKAGSIVDIPDEYQVLENGKPNLQMTLVNWLKNAELGQHSARPRLLSFDGEKRDFFFPVRIVKAAPGSTLTSRSDDAPQYIALQYLVRRGTAAVSSPPTPISAVAPMKVSGDAPVYREMAAQPQGNRDQPSQTDMAATALTCTAGECPPATSGPLQNLVANLKTALAATDGRTQQIFGRASFDLKKLDRTVRSSCGFSVEELTSFVQSRAAESGVSAEVLLGLMTQESSGRCFVLNSEADRSHSVGLFQINSNSSRFPRCTNDQKRKLRALGSVYKTAQGPRCLENPLINLDEAIRVLRENETLLTSNPPKTFNRQNLSEQDLWRITLSSYNGGARWALAAKADLEKFNLQNQTALNPNSWEDIRVFYLRRWLERRDEHELFGSRSAGRLPRLSLSNLAYTEALLGRAGDDDGITKVWAQRLKGDRH